MSLEEKNRLLTGMDERRKKALDSLENIDPLMVVHPVSGWRVKDLIAHLTGWEEEVIRVLHCYNTDQLYVTEYTRARIDDFNDSIYQARKELDTARVMADWADTRERLKSTVRAVPDEKFGGTFDWPLDGWQITTTQLIKGMGIHEKMHLTEILTVKQS